MYRPSFVCCLFLILFTKMVSAQGEPVRRGEQPAFPPKSGTAVMFVNQGPLPPSFSGDMLEYLCNSSPMIITGTVESSSVWVNGRALETDSVLRLDSIIKGTETASRVVVSQLGGTMGEFKVVIEQYSLMKPGERYVLFRQVERRQIPPQHSNARRYAIRGTWEGMFRVDDAPKSDSLRGHVQTYVTNMRGCTSMNS